MSTLIQDLQALLSGLAPAGGVWYAVNTAQPPAFPYIVWQRIAGVPNVGLGGASARHATRIQVDIVSPGIAEAAALETAVDALLAGGPVPAVPLGSQDLYEPVLRAFRIVKDYSVWAAN